MRVLRVHNRYKQRGGEDVCFEAEGALLRSFDHEVTTIVISNDDIPDHRSLRSSAKLAAATVWSVAGQKSVDRMLTMHDPDLVHFDNTFPMLSPSVYAACRRRGKPVVQTLHNYRLVCPSATLFRDGHVCEDCLGKTVPYPGVVHGCYRDSHIESGVVAAMIAAHRLRRTWKRDIDRYIALTHFAKGKFVAGGIPEELISIKPNFANVPYQPPILRSNEFLFVGRLAPEKGISTLLDTAALLSVNETICIIGDGPLMKEVKAAELLQSQLQVKGHQTTPQVIAAMQSACALLFPSTWYEGFPMTIVEAFASGLPVIASRLGSIAEIVHHGDTGLLFEPGNSTDLAKILNWATSHPKDMARMGHNARLEYERLYTPERNYYQLMAIYDEAIASAKARQTAFSSSAD